MKIIIQYLIYPAFIFGTLGGLFLAAAHVSSDHLAFLPLVFLPPVIILIVVLERVFPYNEKWNEDQSDFKADLLQTFITLPVASEICQFCLPFLLYIPIKRISGAASQGLLESNFNLPVAFAIALLLCEFTYYWMHRLSHTLPALWNFHMIHHSAKRVYWANAGRFHFFDALLGSAAYLLPIILLQASAKLTILLLLFSGITGFLEHINVNFRAGYLNYIFNSAELHRWHHSELEKESNHNFGKALIIWDILFGTYLLPNRKKIVDVGIQDSSDPKGFKNQFLLPFRK